MEYNCLNLLYRQRRQYYDIILALIAILVFELQSKLFSVFSLLLDLLKVFTFCALLSFLHHRLTVFHVALFVIFLSLSSIFCLPCLITFILSFPFVWVGQINLPLRLIRHGITIPIPFDILFFVWSYYPIFVQLHFI